MGEIMSFKISFIGAGSIGFTRKLLGDVLAVPEFKNIEIAGPGFLNISFKISFWKYHLDKIVKLNLKYGLVL